MPMYFSPLYSGSSGNALFCQYGRTRVLIDAGKPGRVVEGALRGLGAEPDSVDALLVTHEHSDHIAGVGVLARRYHLPVYATRGTWLEMADKIGRIDPELRREIVPEKSFALGDLDVESFPIPHDAAEPVGFRLWGGEVSIAVATDLGHFPQAVYERIAGSDLVLLESNHDPDMLRANPHYSGWLKQRILGDNGHLSNEACARALRYLIGSGTGTIILGHLSGENNTPDLARQVSEEVLLREGIRPGTDVLLEVALRDQPGRLYTLESRRETV